MHKKVYCIIGVYNAVFIEVTRLIDGIITREEGMHQNVDCVIGIDRFVAVQVSRTVCRYYYLRVRVAATCTCKMFLRANYV